MLYRIIPETGIAHEKYCFAVSAVDVFCQKIFKIGNKFANLPHHLIPKKAK